MDLYETIDVQQSPNKALFMIHEDCLKIKNMLLRVRLKNIVHFEDTTIDINNGPNLLIGQNNSGKSATLEAIRRCMSTSKSTSLSNPHTSAKLSLISCLFSSSEDSFKQIYSAVVRPASSVSTVESYAVALKCFIAIGKGQEPTFAADLVKESSENGLVREPFQQHVDGVNAIYNAESITFNEVIIEQLLEKLLEKHRDQISKFSNCESTDVSSQTTCETYLRNFIDQHVLITFSSRSLSPLQWTLSEPSIELNPEQLRVNEDILIWSLSGNFTALEQQKEKYYFETITNSSDFEFELVDGRTIAYVDRARKCIPLHKVPNGIYEAKVMSIVLALDRFATICLDDPGMGMAMPMLERMRDLVLYAVKDKVVVLTSHLPGFLAPWIIPYTWLFRRQCRKTDKTFIVNSLHNLSTKDSVGGMKLARIVTSDPFNGLFFAKRIFFVEGLNEFLFMTTLRLLMLTDLDLAESFINETRYGAKEHFRKFMSSLHVIAMAGEAFKIQMRSICLKLGIPHLFLFDFDSLTQNIPKQTSSTDWHPFLEAFSIDRYKVGPVSDDVSILEEYGIFVFNKIGCVAGTLQSVFREFGENENVATFFKENNINIFQKRAKLFHDRNTSSENIRIVVRKVIEISQETETEISRLVRFLIKTSEKCYHD